MRYKVRRLTAGDLFTVMRIAGTCVAEVRAVLGDLREGRVDAQAFGFAFSAALLRCAESDIKPLLADLAGMDAAQLDREPIDAPLAIIESVMAQEDLLPFFERVRKLILAGSRTSGGKST